MTISSRKSVWIRFSSAAKVIIIWPNQVYANMGGGVLWSFGGYWLWWLGWLGWMVFAFRVLLTTIIHWRSCWLVSVLFLLFFCPVRAGGLPARRVGRTGKRGEGATPPPTVHLWSSRGQRSSRDTSSVGSHPKRVLQSFQAILKTTEMFCWRWLPKRIFFKVILHAEILRFEYCLGLFVIFPLSRRKFSLMKHHTMERGYSLLGPVVMRGSESAIFATASFSQIPHFTQIKPWRNLPTSTTLG